MRGAIFNYDDGLLIHGIRRMSSPLFHELVQRPLCITEPPYNIVQSPIKVSSPRASQLIASPLPEYHVANPSNLVAPPILNFETYSKRPSKRRKGVKKLEKPLQQDHRSLETGFVDDGGGFPDFVDDGGFPDDNEFGRGFNDNESRCISSPPESCMKDIIDWRISGEEVAELKARLVPMYWEKLKDVIHAVVRVTGRLYVLQDFHRFGYLMVTQLFTLLTYLGT